MSLSKSIGIIVLSYFICFAITDVAGAILVTIVPGPGSQTFSGHSGYGSIALYYVVWLVAGCFGGAFFASNSLNKTKGNERIQRSPMIIVAIGLLLSAALILIFYSIGEMGVPDLSYSSNYYVLGHRYLTYTFFTSFLAVAFLLLKPGKQVNRGKRG